MHLDYGIAKAKSPKVQLHTVCKVSGSGWWKESWVYFPNEFSAAWAS
jgi:hypothetical protein